MVASKIRSYSRQIFAIMGPSVFIGALFGLYPGYRLYEYTWKDANFCVSCHVHDYVNVGWKSGIHGEFTTCHDCHHQPLRAYLKETYIMLTNPPTFPKDLHHVPKVPNGLCGSCHLSEGQDQSTITGPMSRSDVEKIPKIDNSYQHKLHLSKETDLLPVSSHRLTEQERGERPAPSELSKERGPKRPIECMDCHGGPSNRAHSFRATDSSCLRCHESSHGGTVPVIYGCRTCHYQDFFRTTNALRRSQGTELTK